MTPGARIQAAIEVLEAILGGAPAEKALITWARQSRFAGSKDRAAVRDHVFQALRCRRSYAALGGAETGRGLMIGALRAEGQNPADLFTGAGHAPAPVAGDEAPIALVDPAACHDMPDWLWPRLVASLGQEDARTTAGFLQRRAPVALRVNTRAGNREKAIAALEKDGIACCASDVADTGLIVTEGARAVAGSAAYKAGLVELQDISSQAAMACLSVPPRGKVLDYCAGGGGKTLALAARENGRWYVHDATPERMRDMPDRARRAGVRVNRLATRDLRAQGPFDLVLCDVPCSGSGTWRRAPDAKWRLTEERLRELLQTQADILTRTAPLVAVRGMLAYATCSVLREENEDQVAAFLAHHPGWTQVSSRRWPVSKQGDGFFLAVLQHN